MYSQGFKSFPRMMPLSKGLNRVASLIADRTHDKKHVTCDM